MYGNPFNFIVQNVLPHRTRLGNPTTATPDRERSRFMAFMNWDVKMQVFVRDPREQMKLKPLLENPKKSSRDPLLKIQPAFLELLETASKYFGGGSNQAFAIRKHILYGRDVPQIP